MSTIVIHLTQCFNDDMTFSEAMDEIGFKYCAPAVRDVFRRYWRLLEQEYQFRNNRSVVLSHDEVST